MKYKPERLGPDSDDGTMVDNVRKFSDTVVGRRITHAEQRDGSLEITLDDGRVVSLVPTEDCCAYTEVEEFLLNADKIDNIITGVGTTDGFSTWHVFADFGDVMQVRVNWSCGNPFYYMYGFIIKVEELKFVIPALEALDELDR